MQRDIIDDILDGREIDGSLNIEDEEFTQKEEFRRKKSKEMYKFIDSKIHPKVSKPLIEYIERYINAFSSECDYETRIYYKAGFSDAVNIILTSLRYF